MLADNQCATPLHWAAYAGSKKGIEILLREKAEVNATDQLGRTPLFYAAHNAKDASVSLLLQAGATQDSDQDGRSPIHCAVSNGNMTVLQYLLQYPHQINAVTSEGASSLHWAAEVCRSQCDSLTCHTDQ